MQIFIQVVLPVILVFFIGYLIQKWKRLDIKPISTLAIYVMTPCLVFRVFYTADLNMQYLYMVVFALILLFSIIAINMIYAKFRKYPQDLESSLILSTAFMNSGNYGAPIILFAYGDIGFAYSVSFLVLQAVIMNFFGVYYAARGKASIDIAVKSVFMMPATYAVIIALLLKALHLDIPQNLFQTITIIADATIPTVMLILGMQLANIQWAKFEWGHISYGVIVRLLISPIIAYAITLLFPFDPILAKVLIVSAAMPSAATIVMYAIQFDAKPKLVSAITLVTTIISVFTITILLILLG